MVAEMSGFQLPRAGLPSREAFTATANFRWHLPIPGLVSLGTLQQMWQGNRGTVQWRDVPIVVGPVTP
jgi:hypothetical protein